jgi:hypothetical protein
MKRLAQLAASLALVTSSCADPPPDSSTLSVYSISGAVSGATAAVTVNLTGAKSATTMTDASGRYVFSALPSGTYTATPSLEGHVFSPAGRAVMVGEPNVNVTGQDFAGTSSGAAIHGISGNVTDQASGAGLANVVLHVSGASTSSAATGPSGGYEFSGLPDGSYTVTPSLAGYVFSPASIGISVNSGDVAGQNFVASASADPTYSISGTISGPVASSVTVTLSGASSAITVTDSSGNYAFTVANGSYTVTPSLTGYAFNPASIDIPVNGGDVAGQNFVAAESTYAISGTISGAVASGVTVTLGGASSATAVTDSSGDYAFTVANGSYTVTPSLTGYVFSPDSIGISVNGGDVAGQSFTASDAPWHSVPSGTTSALYDLWGSSASDVWAVGADNTFRRWDGSVWSPVTNPWPGHLPLTGLWGSGPNDVWALGIHRLHWDGSSWSNFDSGMMDWRTVDAWGSGPNDVWGVGDIGVVEHWDGSSWSHSRAAADIAILSGVWGSGPNDVWAVGSSGTLLRWNGSAWLSAVSGTTNSLNDVWGSGPNDVWAVGESGTILHWDGSAWSSRTSGTTNGLHGLWGSGPNDVWAVGSSSTIVHWDGNAWSSVASDTTANLHRVWGSGLGDMWAVGAAGVILHR